MSNNTQQLQQWCEQQLKQPVELEALSGDASFRKYFRVNYENGVGEPLMAVDAPPSTEKNAEFVAIAEALANNAVPVPAVIAADLQRGFMLQGDLGDQLLLPLLDDQSVDGWYQKALALIVQMQGLSVPGELDLPDYDAKLLQQEMALFPEWFIGQMLGVELADTEQRVLQVCFSRLEQSALNQPQVFVHRDYHARNIMVKDDRLFAIDFQDAVKGAITYDVVSLLRDCYVQWSDLQVYRWLEQFRQMLIQAGVEVADQAEFERQFDWMGLQRHIKVLGIFARLYLRDGKPGYLADLPRVLHYTVSMARKYPEFSEVVALFEQRLMPEIEKQDWWQS